MWILINNSGLKANYDGWQNLLAIFFAYQTQPTRCDVTKGAVQDRPELYVPLQTRSNHRYGHEKVAPADRIQPSNFVSDLWRGLWGSARPTAVCDVTDGRVEILKFTDDLSDEELCGRWAENPYYQCLRGEEPFCHESPLLTVGR